MKSFSDPQFLRRLEDLADQADRQDYPTHTGFLTPAEQDTAAGFLKNRKIISQMAGGYVEAERKICIILPSGYTKEQAEPETILVAVKIKTALQRVQFGRSQQLTHRDFLGSLLGLGIRRDQIGDILVDDGQAIAIIQAGILPLLQLELKSVGNQAVSLETVPLTFVEPKDSGGSLVRISVASMRFDKIASAGFSVSRSDMAAWIESGQVQLNWRAETRPDRLLSIGDVISLRGFGRIRIVSETGKSRKDRHLLELERY